MTYNQIDMSDLAAEAERNIKSFSHYEQDLDARPEYEPVSQEVQDRLMWGSEGRPDQTQSIAEREHVRFSDPDARDWVNPAVLRRRKRALILPPEPHDLANRITAVMRFDLPPKEVSAAATKAREAVDAAFALHAEARSEEQPRYAVSMDARDAVVQAIATATAAVSNLERVASDQSEAWFNSLTADIADLRDKARKSLAQAEKAYAQWRQAIAGAHALAQEHGRFGDWHHHPDEQKMNALGLIGEIRKARELANSEDDFVSGAYLTAQYDGLPPHTLAYLEEQARVGGYDSYAGMELQRLREPHPADGPALQSIREKDLRIIRTSQIPDLMPSAQTRD